LSARQCHDDLTVSAVGRKFCGAGRLTGSGTHARVSTSEGARTLLEFSHPALAITGIGCWMMFTFVQGVLHRCRDLQAARMAAGGRACIRPRVGGVQGLEPGRATSGTSRDGRSPDVTLLDVLDLERINDDIWRASPVSADQLDFLFGGQVAAQALLAAGLTVGSHAPPHSLHGYFLRRGDSRQPVVFQVTRDRDGRSFSARRVVAIQDGAAIFTMAASFQAPEGGWEYQKDTMPLVDGPADLPPHDMFGLRSLEGRLPAQPYEGLADWPTRFWTRVSVPLGPEPLIHACALAYLSDVSHAILPPEDGRVHAGASVDHALWFHRAADLNRWTLVDLQPRVAGRGRGWYSGSFYTADGTLAASVAQEMVMRG